MTWVWHASTAITAPAPNDLQGFGRIHLEDVLSAHPAKDYINESHTIVNSQSQPWSKTYTAHEQTLPVKVVLAWTDPPGPIDENDGTTRPLVNNLNLRVDVGAPCSTRYIGNQMRVWSGVEESTPYLCTQGLGVYDDLNNVEVITFYPSPGALSFTVAVSGSDGVMNQNFAVVVHNGYDATVGTPPAMPSNFSATATSTTSALVSWSPSSGATAYELRRKSFGGPFATIVTQAATSFSDSNLGASTSYIYQVRSMNGTAPNRFFSAYTTPNVATTMTFADDPLQAQQTLIRKAHVDELRTAANALRAAVGLSAFSFSETLSVGVTNVRASHITELREAMVPAFISLGTSLSFSRPTLTPGTTVISKVDIEELRNAVK